MYSVDGFTMRDVVYHFAPASEEQTMFDPVGFTDVISSC